MHDRWMDKMKAICSQNSFRVKGIIDVCQESNLMEDILET